jgi:GNAT superfamily N-acetyltransferase
MSYPLAGRNCQHGFRVLRQSDDRSAFQSGYQALDRFFHRYAGQNELPRYPIPVLGLARLAVDKSAQSMGLGAQLLRFVLKLALNLAGDVGCAGVVVDAKPGAVDFYAKYGFVPFELLEGQSEARPQPTAMWLPLQAIKVAAETAH